LFGRSLAALTGLQCSGDLVDLVSVQSRWLREQPLDEVVAVGVTHAPTVDGLLREVCPEDNQRLSGQTNGVSGHRTGCQPARGTVLTLRPAVRRHRLSKPIAERLSGRGDNRICWG